MSSGENERLAGRYRVIGRLGRGGMGIVWRALDEVLGREVAVKELRTYTDSSGPELAALTVRMKREARAAARVRHPGVIAVHDVAEHHGRPVIVMELIDGPSLDDVLREHGVMDAREVAGIGAKVMEALGAAHSVGVLHRDVKPGNVLLDRGGRVVLTDFGIAAMDDPGDGSTTRLTRSGELVGSLDYLAPERAQGTEPGPASDIWALGATLYAAVVGSSPFRRTSTWSTLTAIVADPLPEPQRAGALGPVLQQLMHKDPTRRPDAETAARLLAAVAAGEDTDGASTVHLDSAAHVPAAATWVPTVLNAAPHQPEGLGASTGQASAPASSTAPARRSRARTLIAAGVAAVLLAGGGVTYALVDRDGTSDAELAGDATSPSDRASKPATGDQKKPGRKTGKKPADKAKDTDKGAGSDPAARPVCHANAGKFTCQVWRAASSYTASGVRKGTLNTGPSYFYCQQNLGRRETSGQWTNVWWAKTDDDTGNTNVFVSVVYIKGGGNDKPLPGLPIC
ncbi:serine/threonine-protein kinase [Streptomyces sp. NPDC051907]|uniref:serine/threonine-protein kinase n=1 Tax=Streptomyces sp. NPDC051907 TaxID=3155284 RepID=UPI00343D2759